MKRTKAIIGVCVASALLIGITSMTQNHSAKEEFAETSNERYDTLIEEGAIEVGFKVAGKETRSVFGKKQFQLNIDIGENNIAPLEVDETTYEAYEAGAYITCAYLTMDNHVQIAPKLTGR